MSDRSAAPSPTASLAQDVARIIDPPAFATNGTAAMAFRAGAIRKAQEILALPALREAAAKPCPNCAAHEAYFEAERERKRQRQAQRDEKNRRGLCAFGDCRARIREGEVECGSDHK